MSILETRAFCQNDLLTWIPFDTELEGNWEVGSWGCMRKVLRYLKVSPYALRAHRWFKFWGGLTGIPGSGLRWELRWSAWRLCLMHISKVSSPTPSQLAHQTLPLTGDRVTSPPTVPSGPAHSASSARASSTVLPRQGLTHSALPPCSVAG